MIYVCSLNVSNDAIISGKSVINTLEELYVALADTSARLIDMEADFIDKYFTAKSLNIFMNEAVKVNRFLEVRVPGGKLKEKYKEIRKLKSLKTRDGLVSYVMQEPSALSLIGVLCESYEKEQTEALKASAKIGTMSLEQAKMAKELELLQNKYDVLKDLYKVSVTKLDTLVSRINYKYNKDIDPDKMLGLKVDFRKYTKILYIKEITRVIYTDTLIYYLQEILKTLYSVPTRFVVIEAPYAYEKAKMYPRCKEHLNLSYADVYSSDIFMAGFQAGLMEDILGNPSNVKFLIILDRSGWANNFVTGDGVEPVYTVSDVNDMQINVPLMRLISYSKNTLHIPYMVGFDKLSMEEKIGRYSSLESVKALIDLMERGE